MRYIRIPYELIDRTLWNQTLDPTTRAIFLYLINRAAHKACDVQFFGKPYSLQKGEFIITQRSVAK